jgi:hypothetical protein
MKFRWLSISRAYSLGVALVLGLSASIVTHQLLDYFAPDALDIWGHVAHGLFFGVFFGWIVVRVNRTT